MLMPKRVKFRKSQRGKMKGPATRGNHVAFGDFGLMSLETGWLSAKEIEAGRVAASHAMGTEGRLYIRVFPHKAISGKPAEVRMGQGKGEPEYYAACVRPGTVLFEVSGVTEDFARQLFSNVAHKMSLRCKMVARRSHA
jgi:large subunit ribosomal protein L16